MRRDSISGWTGGGRTSSRDPQGCISAGTLYGIRAWLVGDRRVCFGGVLRVVSTKNDANVAQDIDATTKLAKTENKSLDSPTRETSRCSRKRLEKCFNGSTHHGSWSDTLLRVRWAHVTGRILPPGPCFL